MGKALLSKALIQQSADGWGFTLFVSCLAWGYAVLRSTGSMVSLMATSKKTYTWDHFQDCCCQYPHPCASHCWPMLPQETLKHSQAGLAQSLVGSLLLSLGPGVHKVLLVPSKCLWWLWSLLLNAIEPLLLSRCSFSFALGCGVSFLVGSNILLTMIVQQWVALLVFSQEKMSTSPCTLPSFKIRCIKGVKETQPEFRGKELWMQAWQCIVWRAVLSRVQTKRCV